LPECCPHEKYFVVIINNGTIYKNTLQWMGATLVFPPFCSPVRPLKQTVATARLLGTQEPALGAQQPTPKALSAFTNDEHFQQIGEPAFRSKVTRIG
jgi:hypothetical protein